MVRRAFVVSALLLISGQIVFAQNPELQARIAEIKESAAANKQALAQYTWQEQQTISIKGEVKKQQLFQVRLGPDGKPQKTPLDAAPPQQPSGGRLKRKVVEHKKEEFEDYAQQIGELVHSYIPPDPQKLQAAYQQGNVSLSSAGAPNEVKLVIRNYEKPGDSMTLVFDRSQKALLSVQLSSYLKDPKDAVTASAEFSRLPDGTSHVQSLLLNGESKKLTVQTQNSNYQKM